jgi:hypothetical protein
MRDKLLIRLVILFTLISSTSIIPSCADISLDVETGDIYFYRLTRAEIVEDSEDIGDALGLLLTRNSRDGVVHYDDVLAVEVTFVPDQILTKVFLPTAEIRTNNFTLTTANTQLWIHFFYDSSRIDLRDIPTTHTFDKKGVLELFEGDVDSFYYPEDGEDLNYWGILVHFRLERISSLEAFLYSDTFQFFVLPLVVILVLLAVPIIYLLIRRRRRMRIISGSQVELWPDNKN